jgi:hypothetical protein
MKNLDAKEFMKLLTSLYACNEAKAWAEDKDLLTVWETCERGDWMLWLLGKMADKPSWLTRKEVVGIACDCAETALKYVKPGETRPAECIAVVRKWIAGTATIGEVKIVRIAAEAAAAYADAAAEAYAAEAYAAAAYAAADADADAYAAAYADAAAEAAAYVAAYAAEAAEAAAAYAAAEAADAYAYAAAAYVAYAAAAYVAYAADAYAEYVAYVADAADAAAAYAADKTALKLSADICRKSFTFYKNM